MPSSLDKVRKMSFLKELDGEAVVHASTGSYDAGRGRYSVWRLGAVYLTETALAFVQGPHVKFRLLLNNIKGVRVIERLWVMNKRLKQLEITYIDPIMKKEKAYYFAVQEAEVWKKKI